MFEWQPPKYNGGSPITNYIVFKREKRTGDLVKITTLSQYDSFYKVSGLKEGTEYFFAVAAENKAGPGESAETTKAIVPQKAASKLIKYRNFFFYILMILLNIFLY